MGALTLDFRRKQAAGGTSPRDHAVMSSWHEAFANQYDEWSARMTEDIPFYV